jgi:DHA1 family bicyclomycin/chloramphenicol resistance-like MFS transporter
VVASLLIAVAPSFPALVALRFVQAIGGSAGIVISRAIVRDLYSGRELARAMATIMGVFTLAPAAAPVIGWAILLVAPWQGMFVALALFGVAGLVGVTSLHETLEPARRTSHGFVGALRQYGQILGTRSFRFTAAVAALGSVALFAYISASPAVFIDTYGLDRGAFTLLFAGLSLLLALGAQVNRRLLRGRHVLPLLQSSVAVQVLASAVVLVMALLTVHVGVLLVPLGFALMTVVAVNSNAMSLSIDPFPHAAASAAALTGGLQQGFAGITSALLSALAFAPSVEMGATMLAASSVSLGLLVLYRRGGAAQRPQT